ncbi:MAG: aldo/keto reductase [Chloroflexi bacterium]|nr:aldo/keto reductase [Chloroflexota bacterium]
MSINFVMERRTLEGTAIAVTPIGLGGAWLGHVPGNSHRDEDAGIATVLRALELGIRLIDTSGGYGDSERIIGLALREWYRRGGRREDIVISTKTGTRTQPRDYSAGATHRSVETSLQLLQTDYIDVLLVHDPHTLDPVFAPGGALEVLQHLKAQGTIHAIGLGVRNHQHHMRCITSGHFDMVLTYGDYNLLNQSAAADILPTAEQHHVAVFNAMVVEYGLLSGRDPLVVTAQRKDQHPDKVQKARALWEWAQSHHIDLLSVALQYSARDPRIASTLVGAARPEEIEADLQAFAQPIPDTVWTDLHEQFGL